MEMKFYPSHVNKNDICIDLGANIGNASLVMWIKGVSKIYALEPNLEAFNVLKKKYWTVFSEPNDNLIKNIKKFKPNIIFNALHAISLS